MPHRICAVVPRVVHETRLVDHTFQMAAPRMTWHLPCGYLRRAIGIPMLWLLDVGLDGKTLFSTRDNPLVAGQGLGEVLRDASDIGDFALLVSRSDLELLQVACQDEGIWLSVYSYDGPLATDSNVSPEFAGV